ncbi:MAG: single-stranded-DNA-specific exonuclease RecJ [Bacteroidetes bacterium]|nr:single-stranded-DNA-specific exonuclease RecJ [Bacteroidota bacterium]
MNKRWLIKPKANIEKIETLSNSLNISNTISSLLLQRDINSFETAKKYFRPSLEDLYDPYLLKDMDKAIDRIIKAIDDNHKILIYGDYDVDGSTSVAMIFDFFSLFTQNISYYIPDRYTEGYGISEKAINWAFDNDFKLLISFDCGIREVDNISLAINLGIDVIITDHHEPGNELPPALAIVNPKQKDCKYPFKGLSGCGVGFKIMQAISQYKELDSSIIYNYLDLVTVSIASDIVPIIDENRILAYHGLKVLENNPRPGLQALKELIGIEKGISISKLVFGIGPRINAAGRIEHAKLAVQLLLSKDMDQAYDLAYQLNQKNDLRKNIDSNITSEALEMIEADLSENKSTVLYKEDWHKGVLGIVASRCIEKYYRPTVILTCSDNLATGSVRSVDGYNVYNAVDACKDLLNKYGGHAYAAGLTLDINNIDEFKKKFESFVENTIDSELLKPLQKIDLLISFNDINWKMFNIIKQMAPFGPGNMNPTFASENLVAQEYKVLKDKHIKMKVTQLGTNLNFSAIGFNMVDKVDLISNFRTFNMVYKIEENIYRDIKSLVLNIKDIK